MDALIQSLVQSNFAPDRIVPQASMAQYTTLRIGGPADVLVNVVSADEIAVALHAAKNAGAPVTIIGNGSNLLVRDGGIRGLVLRVAGGMNAIRREGDRLIVEAGASRHPSRRLRLGRRALRGWRNSAAFPAQSAAAC